MARHRIAIAAVAALLLPTTCLADPLIGLDKLVNPVVPVGEPVVFTYVVTNLGTEALHSILVSDDNATPGDSGDDFFADFFSGDDNTNNLLDLSEQWIFTAFTIALPGLQTNTAIVTGFGDVSGGLALDTAEASYFGGEPPSVPEPSSLLLLGAGILGLAWRRLRKQ